MPNQNASWGSPPESLSKSGSTWSTPFGEPRLGRPRLLFLKIISHNSTTIKNKSLALLTPFLCIDYRLFSIESNPPPQLLQALLPLPFSQPLQVLQPPQALQLLQVLQLLLPLPFSQPLQVLQALHN